MHLLLIHIMQYTLKHAISSYSTLNTHSHAITISKTPHYMDTPKCHSQCTPSLHECTLTIPTHDSLHNHQDAYTTISILHGHSTMIITFHNVISKFALWVGSKLLQDQTFHFWIMCWCRAAFQQHRQVFTPRLYINSIMVTTGQKKL